MLVSGITLGLFFRGFWAWLGPKERKEGPEIALAPIKNSTLYCLGLFWGLELPWLLSWATFALGDSKGKVSSADSPLQKPFVLFCFVNKCFVRFWSSSTDWLLINYITAGQLTTATTYLLRLNCSQVSQNQWRDDAATRVVMWCSLPCDREQ